MAKYKKQKWETLYITDYQVTDVFPIIGTLIAFGFNPKARQIMLKREKGFTYVDTKFLFVHPENKSRLYFSVGKQNYRFKWIKNNKVYHTHKDTSYGMLYLTLFNCLTNGEFANAKSAKDLEEKYNGKKDTKIQKTPKLRNVSKLRKKIRP